MKQIRAVESKAIPLKRDNVDTDQIIPARHLKRVDRAGFGEFLFEALREDPEFIFNDARYDGAEILVTGENFGCGSSREHAPWALEDYGIHVIIAPSFADIFRNNCVNVGIASIVLGEKDVAWLLERSETDPGVTVNVDLENKRISSGDRVIHFEMDDHVWHRLINGLDHVSLTLEHTAKITEFERRRTTH